MDRKANVKDLSPKELADKHRAIRKEHIDNWESAPAHLRYDLYDNEMVWRTHQARSALRMISAYLDHLHAGFQIQRLLRRHTQNALPGLLEIAMNLLSTVLIYNKNRNHEYNVQRHFATLVLFYCLPSAGVLALELRRCTLENVPLPSTVSRADIIRNLSVLISCVEWAIVPDDGNHRLCSELNKMIALVLDEVLNYQPPSNEGQGDGASTVLNGVGAGFFDLPMIDGMEPIPTESEDFLNWLDNANWNNTVGSINQRGCCGAVCANSFAVPVLICHHDCLRYAWVIHTLAFLRKVVACANRYRYPFSNSRIHSTNRKIIIIFLCICAAHFSLPKLNG